MKTTIIVILCAVACITYLYFDEIGEDEIYLVPKGYQGAVYVIFNQKSGEPVKYADRKRIYEIPESGVLRTQFDIEEKWQHFPQCFYVENDNWFELPFKIFGKDVVGGDSIQACCISVGGTFKNNGKKSTLFNVFYVGTEKVIDSAFGNRTKVDLSNYIEE